MKYYLILLSLVFLMACNNPDKTVEPYDPALVPKETPKIAYNIVNVYPHDTSAYTQGLQLYNGKLYEGTGEFNQSTLRIVDIKTGQTEQKFLIKDSNIFGEGVTIFNKKIYQLTWQSHKIFVYNVNNIMHPKNTRLRRI